ncbi:hypothetical protein [Peribacillus simplex]|uniref:hypothetical protein n=1 Tax=Peribacillus TaxID=2675229 RepID=UPI0036DC1C68
MQSIAHLVKLRMVFGPIDSLVNVVGVLQGRSTNQERQIASIVLWIAATNLDGNVHLLIS